jgi:hypothetical protein
LDAASSDAVAASDAARAAPGAVAGVKRAGKRRASGHGRSPEDDAACRAATRSFAPATRTSARLSALAARPDPVALQLAEERMAGAEIERVLAKEKADLQVENRKLYT